MTEIEITEIPPLQPREQSLLDRHSVLNVLNALWGELTIMGLELENDGSALRDGLAVIEHAVLSLPDPHRGLDFARNLEVHRHTVVGEIDRKFTAHPHVAVRPDLLAAKDSVLAAFGVLRVRARELLARARNPELWIELPIAELEAEVRTLLKAIETRARGRFRIVYEEAQQGPHDYYVEMRIGEGCDERLRLPLVLKDVLCDLVANARKYTAPGGRIAASLMASDGSLKLRVNDTGRGIPRAELAEVVNYGRRGSNALDVRGLGGGFGLTKAFFVAKQFGGRFWIASELGHGTRITIEIPVARSASTTAGARESAIGMPGEADPVLLSTSPTAARLGG